MRIAKWIRAVACVLCLAAPLESLRAEDGYELWLRYRMPGPERLQVLSREMSGIAFTVGDSATRRVLLEELDRAFAAFTGGALPRWESARDGALLAGTADEPAIAALMLPLAGLGEEGYLLRQVAHRGARFTVLAANTDRGLLYGAFALLAHLQTGASLQALSLQSAPRVGLRMLNHWDNPDGHVERGYAGASLWDWWRLPELVDPRYRDYARANASIGINATVLNNVNASAAMLQPEYLAKVRVLADEFRPYGIRVFLSVRFSAPVEIGGLHTADPLDAGVRRWWRDKAAEIHALIPDFGGFLVKANSEGQPGPRDYGRDHADGANMLAEALRPYGGTVLWRAFVYSEKDPRDRAMQAFDQLQGLDGRFADNVVLQVKNGPIDFQPREPFHPLFGAMPRTALGMEFQITKEYLGFATHLAYLGPLYEEVLRADTHAAPTASTVADIVAGAGRPGGVTAMAGVANTGRDRNWCGSHFDQANWYVFGRMAWDPGLSARDVAEEWVVRTFATPAAQTAALVGMMMESREAVVDYMTPLGLAHLMGTDHHHGPAPWVNDLRRPEWNPSYYHRADAGGIGFDRGPSGSNAVAQYAPAVAASFGHADSVPLSLLLWFHRVAWNRELATGRTLWTELLHHYDRGVSAVSRWRELWADLAGMVDAERHAHVAQLLAIQHREAWWWRDASIAYWMSVSGLALPEGVRPPARTLAEYQSMRFPHAPGH